MRKPVEFDNFPDALAASAPYGPYQAVVSRIVDGDTIYALVSVGFDLYAYAVIRLRGIDAAELFTGSDRGAGARARDHLAGLIPVGSPVVLETERSVTTFGRYVARVWMADGREAGAVMIADGFAAPLSG